MKKDIDKLADYIVEVCREGLALENEIVRWRKMDDQLRLAGTDSYDLNTTSLKSKVRMLTTHSSDNLFAKHAARLESETRDRAPFLTLFQNSREEQQQKILESVQLQILMESQSDPTIAGVLALGEKIAQAGREAVRFERWLNWNVRGVRCSS